MEALKLVCDVRCISVGTLTCTGAEGGTALVPAGTYTHILKLRIHTSPLHPWKRSHLTHTDMVHIHRHFSKLMKTRITHCVHNKRRMIKMQWDYIWLYFTIYELFISLYLFNEMLWYICTYVMPHIFLTYSKHKLMISWSTRCVCNTSIQYIFSLYVTLYKLYCFIFYIFLMKCSGSLYLHTIFSDKLATSYHKSSLSSHCSLRSMHTDNKVWPCWSWQALFR